MEQINNPNNVFLLLWFFWNATCILSKFHEVAYEILNTDLKQYNWLHK